MSTAPRSAAPGTPAPWTAWRSIVAFGLVSLSADMVYEGMRSVSGPYLASLGATALVVGVVTGAGEAAALVLRLVAGPLADRSGRHLRLTTTGYAMTAVCVPLLALAPFVGAAGLALASALILLERAGKAVRSPSKSALLAGMTEPVGRGRGFGVHKALDQLGAFLGPLLVAAVVWRTDVTWPAFVVLAVPGAVTMVLLSRLRARAPVEVPDPRDARADVRQAGRLPRDFYLLAVAVSASTFGLLTFGVIGFHLVDAGLVGVAAVPLVYAGAMALEALGALGTGWAYDRWRARVLLALPVVTVLVPLLSFSPTLGVVLVGVGAWALATAVQDSTVKALVADLVPRARLATAYGVFAAFQGVAALAGGSVAGLLYAGHRTLLVVVVAALQAGALALLALVLTGPRAQHPDRPTLMT